MLRNDVSPIFSAWGFRPFAHPLYERPIWAPYGLALTFQRSKEGLAAIGAQCRFRIDYDFINAPITAVFEVLSQKMKEEGWSITYRVQRPEFFVIASQHTLR